MIRKQVFQPTPKLTHIKVKSPSSLMIFLLDNMGGMKKNSVKSLLRYRQVSVNEAIVTQFDYSLKENDVVTVNTTRGNTELQHPLLKVLYEDRDFIVVNKKEGLLSVTTGGKRDVTAFSILKNYTKKISPNNKIYTVHRLDRETSGVLLFSKNRDLQHDLRNNWHTLVQKRTYVALVEGRLDKDEGTIQTWLTEQEVTLKVYSSGYDNGGKIAVTHYKRLMGNADYALLELELETGRRNQIRSHMQYIGHPIVGDRKYGSTKSVIGRVALHAMTLSFVHPMTGKRMDFVSPIPKSFSSCFARNNVD